MNKVAQQPAPIDLLRLSETERQALNQYLAREQAAREGPKNRRASARFRPPSPQPVSIQFLGADQGGQTFLALTKDLSTTGCALFHGAFVYPSARCCVTIKALDGQRVQIAGAVTRCSHVLGRVHEVGILFDQSICLEEFVRVDPDSAVSARAAGVSLPEKLLDTPSVRTLIAEIAALAGNKDCSAGLRNKIHDLAKMSDFLTVDTAAGNAALKQAAEAEPAPDNAAAH